MSRLVAVIASSIVSHWRTWLCCLLRSLYARRVLIRRPLLIWRLTLPLGLLLTILQLLSQLQNFGVSRLILFTKLLILFHQLLLRR